jgi:hypothetical protein
MMLVDAVTVARRFQRSVRVDTDLGAPAALLGFVCQGSARAALNTMARLTVDSAQRAFTWTGPYGSGKSSLALAMAAAVGGDPALRKAARELLGDAAEPIDEAFPGARSGWLVVPVVGRRADPINDLGESLARALGKRRKGGIRAKDDGTGRALINRLQAEAAARDDGGVLVLIDEMGKFLEAAAGEGIDIHFFQELAEAAGRSDGRLVVVGILHQAFDQYATRLSRESRDEWAKVQGRFVDIPIISGIDEIIDLLGRAIETELPHPQSRPVAERVAATINRRRPGSPQDLAERLDAAWPLHPVVTALLGPVSRRRFGQNERSTFGFLGSSEPEGFWEFLRRITANEYDGKARELKERQVEIALRMEQHQKGEGDFRTTLENLISIASRAAELFERSKTEQKRELLAFVFSNLRLKGKTLEFSLRSPFDLMVNRPDHASWLAFLNTVRTERFDQVLAIIALLPTIAASHRRCEEAPALARCRVVKRVGTCS